MGQECRRAERDRDALRSYAESRAAALAEDEDEDEEEEAEAKDAAMAETTPTANGGCVRQHDEWSKYAELKLEELVWNHPAPVGEFDWTKIATEFNEWAERVGEPERDTTRCARMSRPGAAPRRRRPRTPQWPRRPQRPTRARRNPWGVQAQIRHELVSGGIGRCVGVWEIWEWVRSHTVHMTTDQ